MNLKTFIATLKQMAREIFLEEDIIHMDLLKVFLEQRKIDGYSFADKIPFFFNKPSDADILGYFTGLCEKVHTFLQDELKLQEISAEDIRFGDQVLASKIRVSFYNDLYLVGIVYFMGKEPYSLWEPLIDPNDFDFILSGRKLPGSLKFPSKVPVIFDGVYENLSALDDKDFQHYAEYFFKMV